MAALTILLGENWALRLVTAVKILFVVVFEVTAHISASSAFLGYFCNEMSRLEPRKHSPAKVFAEFTSMGENEGVNPEKMDSKLEGTFDNRREIQIFETGEVTLPPDKAKVSIVCSNTKVSD